MAHSDEFRREEDRERAHNDEEEEEEDEKQISVDPLSLKRPPPITPLFVKPLFVSASLPCSAVSSPDFSSPSSPGGFKKWSSLIEKPHPALHPLLAQHHLAEQAHIFLPRSKSCGDGRSSHPSDEFDILSRRHGKPTGKQLVSESSLKVREETLAPHPKFEDKEEEFKCGALCLFLPGFMKKKQEQVQGRRRQQSQRMQAEVVEEDDNDGERERDNRSVASRVASMERFECASWSSAVILDDIEDGGISAYFDLPLELIRGCSDDTDSPIKTAFVFERERKGVLKKSTPKSTPRKSHENRHVRFSTSQQVPSSPGSVCISPRLFQARQEFNAALLEAQNAFLNS